tara:strand:- start:47 stop:1105 length:1059 start_codon:yes stop_codon:yes gene_type:complete
MHFLTFDTNIYRELGIAFNNNTNFDYLLNFLEKSHYELILQDVVLKELLDYFENDYLKKLMYDHKSVYDRFKTNPYVNNIENINSSELEEKAIIKFRDKLKSTCWKIQATDYIKPELLIDFSISNKRESKKDNTRDFIIWNNLINLASQYPNDKIIFISRDKIFTENIFFKNMLKVYNIKNIIVIESIPKYLSDYGLQVGFLNKEIVLNSIDESIIKTNLLKSINDFPSYVSDYYIENKSPKNISFEILDIQIYEYYTYSEDKSDVTLISSFLVKIKAIYDKETRVDLNDYPNHYPKNYKPEEIKHRIDNENRAVYENYVLCMFQGKIDLKSERIINQNFDDFIPDWNVEKK